MSYSDLAESASETKEQLVANLRRVVSDAEDLLAATAGQTDTKITELRARAERELGNRFDIRGFHDEVLRDGSVPLPVLEAKVDRWIASRKK